MKTRFLLILLAALSPAVAQAAALEAAFADPPASARPMLRWWWPGGDVTRAGLEAELRASIAAGFGAVEIQPFRAGLAKAAGTEADRIDSYGTAEFFGHLGEAARFADAHGIALDYTFGSGWPSGGPAVSPEHAALELRAATRTLAGPLHLHQAVPMPPAHEPAPIETLMPPPASQALPADWVARLAARRHIVAVLAVRGAAPVLGPRPGPPNPFFAVPPDVVRSGVLDPGSTVDLTGRVAADGTLDWQVPAGQWQLITLTEEATGQMVALAAGRGPQLAVDHLDRAAFDAYAAWHAARLRAVAGPGGQGLAGHGLRALFVDSFELHPEYPWAADFLAQFRARRGYALTPYLPLILLPHWMDPYAAEASRPLYVMGAIGERVREDYHRTVGELMQERFFAPLRDWAHAQGLALRLQAHGAPADLIGGYAYADIPETEDLFDGPVDDFMSYARAAADIYGRPVVSAESMILVGHTLDATPAMYKARADLLFAAGVAQLVEHGMPYPAHAEAGIGWAPFGAFVGNDFDPANPLFGYLRPLNEYEARLGTVWRGSQPVISLLIYQDALFQHAQLDVPHAQPDALHAALHAAGYGVDTMTLDGLLRSHGAPGAIVSPGGHVYRTVLIAGQAALDRRAAETLARLAAGGLRIVFVDQVPDRAAGWSGRTDDAAVRAAVARIAGGRPEFVAGRAIGPALARAGIAPELDFGSGMVPGFALREEGGVGGRRFVFVANPGATPMPVGFTIRQAGPVQAWYPWTGQIGPSDAARPDGAGGLRFGLTLPAYGSALFAIGGARSGALAPPRQGQVSLLTLGQAGWALQATGFNGAGQAVNTSLHLPRLQDWRSLPQLGNFSGVARYALDVVVPRHDGALSIDLGEVHDAARISVNGCSAGLVMAPWRVAIGGAVHDGVNRLVIEVANRPQNGEVGRTIDGVSKVSGTVPAGLAGPVRLLGAAEDPAVPTVRCARAAGAKVAQDHAPPESAH